MAEIHPDILQEMEEPSNKKQRKEASGGGPFVGPFSTSERFLRLIVHTTVDVVRPPENKIYVAARTDKVVDVWKGLVEHNFLSVPVLQKTKHRYYGFVDLYDIVKFVIEFFGETEELKNSNDWFAMANNSEEFRKKTVNDIMKYPLTKRNPFFPIHSGFSLFCAIEALAREKGLHRVPVIDEERLLITVVTQSQVNQILFRNLDILGGKKDLPMNQMKRYFEDVISIPEDATAIEAFRTMVEKNISGLAVVDKEGKLTANISLKDLKAMSTDARLFWRLFQTVHNFLLKVRKENNEHSGDRPRTVVTVKPTDTLETVIRKLSEFKIHKVYVVDEHKKPVSVISLKDILYEIIS